MDKALEARLREAIDSSYGGPITIINFLDAKRLLYRLKKENAESPALVYNRNRTVKCKKCGAKP